MPQKLTLVVTCTERKSMPVAHSLRLRSVADSPLGERVKLWTRRLEGSEPKRPLRNLYQGETWAQVRRLELAAERVGFLPEVLVASAGLGLRHIEDSAPGYGATFATGHPDSVPGGIDGAQRWWRQLNATRRSPVLDEQPGPILFVLSERYARVLEPDIVVLSDRDNVLVVGGSRGLPQGIRLPADRGLRGALGGTTTSLNARTAVAWLERLSRPVLVSEESRAAWALWAREARHPDVYNRQVVNDDVVLGYIERLQRIEPTVSKTFALRKLRDAGMACEQQRFGELFKQRPGTR